jgi:hypothetical protein
MSLSYRQTMDLKSLLDPDSFVRNRSCTNATLNALKKRGLVTLEWGPSKYVKGHTVEQWTITDAGRDAINSGGNT